MVIKTGREPDETIQEEVKEGTVEETEEYKYLGVWVNKEGNCNLQIEKKNKKK